jgi:hypothetical protein
VTEINVAKRGAQNAPALPSLRQSLPALWLSRNLDIEYNTAFVMTHAMKGAQQAREVSHAKFLSFGNG